MFSIFTPWQRTSTAPPPNRSVATDPTSTASRHYNSIQKNVPGGSAPPPQRPPSSHHRPTSSQQPMASHVSQVSRSAQQQQVMSRTAASPSSRQVSVSEKEKKDKEKFLMFTRFVRLMSRILNYPAKLIFPATTNPRVLMKYLEQRDQDMHTRAKAQIKECYEKNKQGDPNFKSLTTSLKARLKPTVGDVYWKVSCCHTYRNCPCKANCSLLATRTPESTILLGPFSQAEKRTPTCCAIRNFATVENSTRSGAAAVYRGSERCAPSSGLQVYVRAPTLPGASCCCGHRDPERCAQSSGHQVCQHAPASQCCATP